MKKWTGNVNIDVPIDEVWKYLDGSLEDMQKIMPNVVENTLVKETEDGVGTVYRQKFKEGKRVQEYDVKTLEYENGEEEKKLKVAFNLANMFNITTTYELQVLEENKTYFRYTTSNEPLKWIAKVLMKLGGGDKVVVQFVNRVKQVAEENYNPGQ
ncbi:SRPBCC family protein [Ornithinibacillus halophilus]|uniref:Polyketide cyclase / dehydrase and lipid transport n=1 Tax=Ornithinibacillus halophilus TaxID=930117 RepID=A0A1M5NXW4_9BACI|nr:SRPBCC family protein [Ornithinibacillus halophilus]SHG93813.1 Polyketide cyclase / dehydrase and lipid transport [Ornithinibacillus halophilus]